MQTFTFEEVQAITKAAQDIRDVVATTNTIQVQVWSSPPIELRFTRASTGWELSGALRL